MIDRKQEFHWAETANEMVRNCNPWQRVILRMLAVCEIHEVDRKSVLSSLAREVPLRYQISLNQLASDDGSEQPLLANHFRLNGLIGVENCLALNMADSSGALQRLCSEIVAVPEQIWIDPQMYNDTSFSRYGQAWRRVMFPTAALTFVLIQIAPMFQEMMEEYGIDAPRSFQYLKWITERLRLDLVLILFMLVLLSMMFYSVPEYLRRWNPVTWNTRRLPMGIKNRTALAQMVQTGLPLAELVGKVAGSESLKQGFFRITNAKPLIAAGQTPWQALQSVGAIQSRDFRGVNGTESNETAAWLLRWSAENRLQAGDRRTDTLLKLVVLAANLLFAAIAILLALFVFTTLIEIMDLLAEWI